MIEANEISVPRSISRRTFLRGATALGCSFALLTAGCALSPKKNNSLEMINGSGNDIPFRFGKEESVAMGGLEFAPDTHIPFIRHNGSLVAWVSAGNESFRVESRRNGELFDGRQPVSPSLFPIGSEDYAALGGVVQSPDQNTLVGFYHTERWKPGKPHFPFLASVGRAISQDSGKTWQKDGDVLFGNNQVYEDGKARGAGQPCTIIKDDYIYLYYTDWNGKQRDGIHLARSPITSLGAKDSWEKFTNNQFVSIAQSPESTSVIPAPEGAGYSALASISFNPALERYLAVFESNNGFWAGSSADAISWDNYQMIARFPQKMSERVQGSVWYSYPSLLSLTEQNDQITTNTGFLYYARGVRGGPPHTMFRIPYSLG